MLVCFMKKTSSEIPLTRLLEFWKICVFLYEGFFIVYAVKLHGYNMEINFFPKGCNKDCVRHEYSIQIIDMWALNSKINFHDG